MSTKAVALAFVAVTMAVAPGVAVADPIIDNSVVRSIEQTAQGTRISFDVHRPSVEQYILSEVEQCIRAVAMRYLKGYSAVKIDKIVLGGAAGSSVLTVTAEFTVGVQVGILELGASGTGLAQITLSVGGGNMVQGQLFFDSISFAGMKLSSDGIPVGTARRKVDLSGVDGAIQRITIVSIDSSWIAFSINVQ